MSVYSLKSGGEKYRVLQVSRQFKVLDAVTVHLRDGKTINGKIIFIEEDKVLVTGPYIPIEEILLSEIFDIIPWDLPEEWK